MRIARGVRLTDEDLEEDFGSGGFMIGSLYRPKKEPPSGLAVSAEEPEESPEESPTASTDEEED
jgi:hypothetical protein